MPTSKTNNSNTHNKPKNSFLDYLSQLLPNTQQYQPLLCKDPVIRDHERRLRRRQVRNQLGKSRSGVQWGPTHSYESSDDEEAAGVVESANCNGGGRRLMCGDGGTTSTTQTCSISKEMSSHGFIRSPSSIRSIRSPSSKPSPSMVLSQRMQSNVTAASTATNNHTVDNSLLKQTKDQNEKKSVSESYVSTTIDRVWNQASVFAREMQECNCHPCNATENYASVHTTSTAHRHKKSGARDVLKNKKKKRQREPLRPIDINIEFVSSDESSLTSTWIGNDISKIKQPQKEQEEKIRDMATESLGVTATKREINTSVKKNQRPSMIKQGISTASTIGRSNPRSPLRSPSSKSSHNDKSLKLKSPKTLSRSKSTGCLSRIKSSRSSSRIKSTKSSSSQKQQQQKHQNHQNDEQQYDDQQHNEQHHNEQHNREQHNHKRHHTPNTTDALKQLSHQQSQRTIASTVSKLPFDMITIPSPEAISLERSISELTMRSCHAQYLAHQLQHQNASYNNRRMAYYAVGQEGDGNGNRRCYFSGRLITGGKPFYAGSVQQGLRTLVVFCLPRSLQLPKRSDLDALLSSIPVEDRMMSNLGSSNQEDYTTDKGHKSLASSSIALGGGATATNAQSFATIAGSHNDNKDDRVAEEVDHLLDKGILKPEQVLDIIPHPDVGSGVNLLEQMEKRYPDQYATLPAQVRLPKCWRLYFKFCFFSGLPIADGEMYYKVIDKITDQLRSRSQVRSGHDVVESPSRKVEIVVGKKGGGGGDELAGVDEIILSHEIMEAVNGEQSAEILRLPNSKTFQYLQKQYPQQCAKLGSKVFHRTSWEMVMPEV